MRLNAAFQRIARRDKKAFLSDQCKEIEENNSMGKSRDLFKKTTDTKGTFHAKMGTIKDRNSMDLTEAEDIKKRWQEHWSGLPFPSPFPASGSLKMSQLFSSGSQSIGVSASTSVVPMNTRD